MRGIIFHPPGLPSDHLIFEGVDATRGPVFKVTETARIFFPGKSGWWLRRTEASLVESGDLFQPKRDSVNSRVYSLADLEIMFHIMSERSMISTETLHHGLMVLMWLGYLHGLLPNEEGKRDE